MSFLEEFTKSVILLLPDVIIQTIALGCGLLVAHSWLQDNIHHSGRALSKLVTRVHHAPPLSVRRLATPTAKGLLEQRRDALYRDNTCQIRYRDSAMYLGVSSSVMTPLLVSHPF